MAEDKKKSEEAKQLARAFKKMDKPASKGGTGGTFTAAANKADYADSPAGRKQFAKHVLSHKDEYSSKMIKKATFYNNIINPSK